MNKTEKNTAIAFVAALVAVLAWRAMPNSPKVRIGGNRVHHGLVGALLLVIGTLSEKPHVAAAGAVLAVDDIEDLLQWLDFKENSTIGSNVAGYPLGV